MFKILTAVVSMLFVGPQHPTYIEIYDIKQMAHLIPDFSIETSLSVNSVISRRKIVQNSNSDTITKDKFNTEAFIQLLGYVIDPKNDGPTEITYWRGNVIVRTTKEYHDRFSLLK